MIESLRITRRAWVKILGFFGIALNVPILVACSPTPEPITIPSDPDVALKLRLPLLAIETQPSTTHAKIFDQVSAAKVPIPLRNVACNSPFLLFNQVEKLLDKLIPPTIKYEAQCAIPTNFWRLEETERSLLAGSHSSSVQEKVKARRLTQEQEQIATKIEEMKKQMFSADVNDGDTQYWLTKQLPPVLEKATRVHKVTEETRDDSITSSQLNQLYHLLKPSPEKNGINTVAQSLVNCITPEVLAHLLNHVYGTKNLVPYNGMIASGEISNLLKDNLPVVFMTGLLEPKTAAELIKAHYKDNKQQASALLALYNPKDKNEVLINFDPQFLAQMTNFVFSEFKNPDQNGLPTMPPEKETLAQVWEDLLVEIGKKDTTKLFNILKDAEKQNISSHQNDPNYFGAISRRVFHRLFTDQDTTKAKSAYTTIEKLAADEVKNNIDLILVPKNIEYESQRSSLQKQVNVAVSIWSSLFTVQPLINNLTQPDFFNFQRETQNEYFLKAFGQLPVGHIKTLVQNWLGKTPEKVAVFSSALHRYTYIRDLPNILTGLSAFINGYSQANKVLELLLQGKELASTVWDPVAAGHILRRGLTSDQVKKLFENASPELKRHALAAILASSFTEAGFNSSDIRDYFDFDETMVDYLTRYDKMPQYWTTQNLAFLLNNVENNKINEWFTKIAGSEKNPGDNKDVAEFLIHDFWPHFSRGNQKINLQKVADLSEIRVQVVDNIADLGDVIDTDKMFDFFDIEISGFKFVQGAPVCNATFKPRKKIDAQVLGPMKNIFQKIATFMTNGGYNEEDKGMQAIAQQLCLGNSVNLYIPPDVLFNPFLGDINQNNIGPMAFVAIASQFKGKMYLGEKQELLAKDKDGNSITIIHKAGRFDWGQDGDIDIKSVFLKNDGWYASFLQRNEKDEKKLCTAKISDIWAVLPSVEQKVYSDDAKWKTFEAALVVTDLLTIRYIPHFIADQSFKYFVKKPLKSLIKLSNKIFGIEERGWSAKLFHGNLPKGFTWSGEGLSK